MNGPASDSIGKSTILVVYKHEKKSVEILLANCEKKEMKVHEKDTNTMAPILPPCVCITNERGVRCFLFIFIPVNI